MLGFAVDTVFDDTQLLARYSRVFAEAAAQLGDAIRDDCEIYVPYDTGNLSESVSRGAVQQTEDGYRCEIIWSAPYASAVYYGDRRGVRYHTDHHAHARARWFDGARAANCDDWISSVQMAVCSSGG